jgi:hypothetical protein
MNTRILTSSEIASFLLRHPWYLLTPLSEGGNYVKDETLGGFVLIYPKVDGETVYVLTDSDPSSNDPSATVYVAEEFLKAVKENTTSVLKIGAYSISSIVIIAAIVLFIIYSPQIKSFIKTR